MARQVKLLKAAYNKTDVYSVLMRGDRYISIERLAAAAVQDIDREEKKALTKKLAALSEQWGGAFRARAYGQERWFATKRLIAAGLARETEAARNPSQERFLDAITRRMQALSAMLSVAAALEAHGFHRTDVLVSPDVDRSRHRCNGPDIPAVLDEAARVLGMAAGAEPGSRSSDGSMPWDEAVQNISDRLAGPSAIRENTIGKIRDRLCALSVVLGTRDACGVRSDADTSMLLAIRDAVLDPGRTVSHEKWASMFGHELSNSSGEASMERGDYERLMRCAAACAGVWDSGPSGPEPSMTAMRLLSNCMSRF